MAKIFLHSARRVPFVSPPELLIASRDRMGARSSGPPARFSMNTNAFTRIVAAILRVCSPSSCLRSSLILWTAPGYVFAIFAKRPAASLTPSISTFAARSTTSGGTVADWVRIDRSETDALIQPERGHRVQFVGESPV